uniref:Copper transporter n=1 Tax=Syphacia muris TaxID=451379 RepID=A0A0N5AAQ4_9BILA
MFGALLEILAQASSTLQDAGIINISDGEDSVIAQLSLMMMPETRKLKEYDETLRNYTRMIHMCRGERMVLHSPTTDFPDYFLLRNWMITEEKLQSYLARAQMLEREAITTQQQQIYWMPAIDQPDEMEEELLAPSRLTYMALYAFQMLIACFIVLALATFNSFVFMGLIVGHSLGCFLFTAVPSDGESVEHFF